MYIFTLIVGLTKGCVNFFCISCHVFAIFNNSEEIKVPNEILSLDTIVTR